MEKQRLDEINKDPDTKNTEVDERVPVGMMTVQRQNSASALKTLIKEKRREADNLQVLLDSLPRALPLEADEALWKLILSSRSL
jgi:hypothetical protein